MPRIARLVVPGIPHHVTQRGVRRMEIFFGDGGYRAHVALLAEICVHTPADYSTPSRSSFVPGLPVKTAHTAQAVKISPPNPAIIK